MRPAIFIGIAMLTFAGTLHLCQANTAFGVRPPQDMLGTRGVLGVAGGTAHTVAVPPQDTLAAQVAPLKTYTEMRAESIRTGRPLMVWVNYACKSTEAQLGDCLHYHEPGTSFHGESRPVVLVCSPSAGTLWEWARVPAVDVCASSLRAPLEHAKRWAAERGTQRNQLFTVSRPPPFFFTRPVHQGMACGPGG